ncbi:DEAD/DEAH box helicase [Turicibacter sanguinis]|uniref:DEAD/DEAH box helicase n=1 Tax=Turicibacter TaxID=191303 RepID=UPI0001FDB325|nr:MULTISPECIES: DEAD/DEAH box helicase [Turicibacter]EGC91951.1 helicase C-terminal domain protein [Turicibacter sp. HGF1]MCU7200857.1 DEAD/DEAH box helicase [Turicibacter sanguinis]MTH06255.1 DEAD/DEAH box helicase [Turicibacter sanguinis]MTH09482.1 DEAD/DEAH box helicase [Turicibacter sanguinis]MTH12157.1 DEAD/DEAH box helicase [Turicibacter sanguinis]
MKVFGTVKVIPKKNPRELYEHQLEAISCLDEMDEQSSFRTLVVIPTGGGKTLTASWWLLKKALNEGKKVLWIAHRQMLLEQALMTFKQNAYATCMPTRWSFDYRIVSGIHDKVSQIKKEDDLLIISKDSLVSRLNGLKPWLKDQKEVYVVIDEAHHAPAKSYQTILNYIDSQVEQVKLLGLTATPFRTEEKESGILAQIFRDDICYKIDLTDLIKRGILARPHFEECTTDLTFTATPKELQKMKISDIISGEIATKLVGHKVRNAMIVNHYKLNQDRYQQTIVFAINRMHALVLKTLFEKAEIRCGIVISRDLLELAHQNQEVITAYQQGKIQVLINVNILTEGIDLPCTKTVFLTRPTVSSILMTQMIGRALRGEVAGGTKDAYLVSFVDDWQDQIAWINSESIFYQSTDVMDEEQVSESLKVVEMISLKQLELFAQMLDDSVDTKELEKIPFIKRVPLGLYNVTLGKKSHPVLVYDSTKRRYEHLIKQLPSFFEYHQINETSLSREKLKELSSICSRRCFTGEIVPAYDERDIMAILKYYAKYRVKPPFLSFDELDREKIDLKAVATFIIEQDLTRSQQVSYIDELWNDATKLYSIYFHKKSFFMRQLNLELRRLMKEGIRG